MAISTPGASAPVLTHPAWDHSPIQNTKLRRNARLPGNVVRLSAVPRLRPGLVAEICRKASPDNLGKLVRILDFDAQGYVVVEALGRQLAMYDLTTGAFCEYSSDGRVHPDNLRRLYLGARHD